MKKLELFFEHLMFKSRWLLAPFFFGIVIAIVVLLIKFGKQLATLVMAIMGIGQGDVLVLVLTLIDSALVASLLLIIALSGYENFVSKINVGEHEDRPAWMGKVGFSDLKVKLMGAIVAITAVELLKAFIESGQLTNTQLAWKVGIHLTFVVSGLLFVISDRISEGKNVSH